MRSAVRANLRGFLVVFSHELARSLFSLRLLILIVLFSFTVLGMCFGFSQIINDPVIVEDYVADPSIYENRDADFVLYTTSAFVLFISIIIAVLSSFDGVVQERLRGSLDLLLSRPVGRRTIALGKFAGIWTAVSIPFALVMVAGLYIVSDVLDAAIDPRTGAAFIGYTLVLIGTYIAIQLTFSTLSKDVGTSVVAGIVFGFIQTFFWVILPLSIAYVAGMPVKEANGVSSTDSYTILSNWLDATNPAGTYHEVLGIAFAQENAVLIDPWIPILSLWLWFFGTILLFSEVFERRSSR